jgi:hypothetical protein
MPAHAIPAPGGVAAALLSTVRPEEPGRRAGIVSRMLAADVVSGPPALVLALP